ncbi:unnamed protein product [Pleuronectes platessa]|uniref:Uncharacterized protein n=1 Tax=Pleuronectes platessa TaxID=8262 RepID=A0A9N7W4N0_PLEPL|nr:unnamed protein product [Pleuronectes platessa]
METVKLIIQNKQAGLFHSSVVLVGRCTEQPHRIKATYPPHVHGPPAPTRIGLWLCNNTHLAIISSISGGRGGEWPREKQPQLRGTVCSSSSGPSSGGALTNHSARVILILSDFVFPPKRVSPDDFNANGDVLVPPPVMCSVPRSFFPPSLAHCALLLRAQSNKLLQRAPTPDSSISPVAHLKIVCHSARSCSHWLTPQMFIIVFVALIDRLCESCQRREDAQQPQVSVRSGAILPPAAGSEPCSLCALWLPEVSVNVERSEGVVARGSARLNGLESAPQHAAGYYLSLGT